MFLEFENFVEFVEILISVTLNVSFNVVAITYINNFQSFFFDFIFEITIYFNTRNCHRFEFTTISIFVSL